MSTATIQTVLAEINRVKQCGRAQLYIYLRQFGIEPLGIRQRPRIYPADTASRILSHLGITTGNVSVTMPNAKAGRSLASRSALVTLPQLRKQRASAKKKTAKKGQSL